MCVSRNLSSAGKASFDGAAASAGCLTHTACVISRLPVADGWYFLQIKAGKFPRKFRHPETDLMTTLEEEFGRESANFMAAFSSPHSHIHRQLHAAKKLTTTGGGHYHHHPLSHKQETVLI